jgi:hypothetical protein
MEEAMQSYMNVIVGTPVGVAIAGLLARAAAQAVCRVYSKLEERRGLEAAIRDSRPTDRADVVRAYAECLAAQSEARLNRRKRTVDNSDSSTQANATPPRGKTQPSKLSATHGFRSEAGSGEFDPTRSTSMCPLAAGLRKARQI